MADLGKPRIYVHPPRKDGRYPVTFVFPTSGRQIKKLLTADKLTDEQNKGSYDIIRLSK